MRLGLGLAMHVKVNHKIAEARAVSRYAWVEAAAWRSDLSGLASWSFRLFRWGIRWTNPLFGFSAGIWL